MLARFFALILSFSFCLSCYAQVPIFGSAPIQHPVVADNGIVATQHAEATKVGLEILKKGGNAVDAAVAVGFSLAVVVPRAGNLGGGGFMMIHRAEDKKTYVINYRETAPGKSHETMYLDRDGNVDAKLYNESCLSIGVPGTVAGLVMALEKYGTMPLSEVIAPAIKLAKEGFPVTHQMEEILKKFESRLKACKSSADIFFKSDNSYYEMGDTLIQTDLAWSMEQIAEYGRDAFYEGELGKRIAKGIEENGGIIRIEDLNNYKAQEIEPVWGNYRGYDVACMPPPSSGGIHIIQMLNILEEFPLKYFGHNSAESIHILAETMRLAYADRSKFLGDPDFWEVPEEGITSKAYADELRKKINRFQANDSKDILPGNPFDYESEETTHFSVADEYGNVVSNTYTLNFSFGTGFMAEGTGILLNNEMGDFSAKPGVPNAYGLIGDKANAIQPYKRPLSSMSPTILFKEGKPFLVTGSPGGSRIITSVLQIILNVVDYEMNIAEASHAPRVHHQWHPDVLYYEKGISHDTKMILSSKGHWIEERTSLGSTQSIIIGDKGFYGASDPRRPDARTMGF